MNTMQLSTQSISTCVQSVQEHSHLGSSLKTINDESMESGKASSSDVMFPCVESFVRRSKSWPSMCQLRKHEKLHEKDATS